MVVKEKTSSSVERGNGSHVFSRQFKIEDVEILLHPFDMC